MIRKQLTDIGIGNISKKNFSFFEKLSTKSMPFLIYQPAVINQKVITMGL